MNNLRRQIKITAIIIAGLAVTATVAAAALPGPRRMLAPTWYGFEKVAPRIYAPANMDVKRRNGILLQIKKSKLIISSYYQKHFTLPLILLCPNNSCDKTFGESKARGTAYGSYLIRLNEKGLNQTIATHEFSHTALKSRVGDIRTFFGAIPAWFDEGLAVLLSNDERFEKSFPPSAAIYMRKTGSFRTWGKSIKALGWKNAYGGSMELVQNLQAEIGDKGLLSILDKVGAGQDFEGALRQVRTTQETN